MKRGISLIILVITIIIIIVLAGAVIFSIADNNPIENAKNAQKAHNQSLIEERIQLAYSSALLAGTGEIDYEVLNQGLEELGYKRGTYNEVTGTYTNDIKGLPAIIEINGEKYKISVGGKGTKLENWVYKEDENGKRTIITNGVIELKIGDYINYNTADTKEGEDKTRYTSPTGTVIVDQNVKGNENIEQGSGYSKNQVFDGKSYSGSWKVLGVDEKTGEILIVATDVVRTLDNDIYYINGMTGFKCIKTELDNICKTFGYGKGASGARSININDINKITGYNPNNVGVYDPDQSGTGKKSGSGTLSEYGNKVDFTWNTTTSGKIDYKGTNNVGGTLSELHDSYGFNWYDEEEKVWKNNSALTGNIATITMSYYYYNIGELLSENSPEYRTLFFNDSGKAITYWLASTYITARWDYLDFGFRYIESEKMRNYWGRKIYR